MKRLPPHQRPYFAKTILEIGGGHDPYVGVTHAVDKYPGDNAQRAGDMKVAAGVVFKEGDLEAIPFSPESKFDFVYASHVLEHVNNPQKAAQEINRVARKGYIATPSPLREQIACPFPFDAASDFHTFYCWTNAQPNTIHVTKKVADRVGEYCDCPNGKLGQYLFFLQRKRGYDLEPMMPRTSKETAIFFDSPLEVVVHTDFISACKKGACAFASAQSVVQRTSFPSNLISRRFRKLGEVLKKHRAEFTS